MKILDHLGKHSKWATTVIGFFLVFVLGVADYLSGAEISFSIFYLIPISLVTWYAGRGAGVLISIASAIIWLLADLLTSSEYSHLLIPLWNAAMRLGVFIIVVQLLSKQKFMNKQLQETVTEKTANLAAELAERKWAEEKLQKSRDQLRQLAAHLQQVREEERTRIAREIHDELGQVLTGLKMDLSWIEKKLPSENGAIREKTKAMAYLIDGTIQAVRRISAELRPRVLDALGLVAAIEWQVQEFERQTDIKCTFTSDQDGLDLDRGRRTTVFRIFQEALTNAARHSNATGVTVNLREEVGYLKLEVKDNGRGITGEELSDSKSLGFVGMRERALILGGSVSVNGAPGSGTTIKLVIPLEGSQEDILP